MSMEPGSAAAELAKLASRHPGYRIWAENRGDGHPRFVAQRIPGSAARLVAVVTPDLGELREALGAAPG